MLRRILPLLAIIFVSSVTCLSSGALAQTATRGGFFGGTYHDGGCWYGGYYHCKLHGLYDATPFYYHFAIYRGCYQTRRVPTIRGSRIAKVFVCDVID
jgi:hypothetical protein